MPTQCSATGMAFGRAGGRELVAAFDGGRVTSDAGALLLGATDRAIRLVDRFAACLRDGRYPAFVTHRVRSLVGQRIFGLALGYEDLVDHDDLRHDPVLGALLGRFKPDEAAPAPLAGKSTLNRLEHAPAEAAGGRYHKIGHDAAAIETVFVALFLDAFRVGLSHTALAAATCGTIRLKLLKIGALVRISARRVKVAMASACPAASEWRLAHARLIIAAPAPPARPAEPQATQAASPSAHGDFAHHPEHPLTALSGAARHHAVVKNTCAHARNQPTLIRACEKTGLEVLCHAVESDPIRGRRPKS